MQIETKIVSCHTANFKPVKQEVNGTMMLPPLVFPALIIVPGGGIDEAGVSIGEGREHILKRKAEYG